LSLIRIGSRGSQLALWQAEHISGLLRGRGHDVEIEIIKTTGDRVQEITFAQVGSKGMFTLEIEEALAAGRIDLAVHSLKDLPTDLPAGFMLGATPQRVDPRDVFVSRDFASLQNLPKGARLGTSSLRRRAQLRSLRPDLEYIEFRGNVDTRLRGFCWLRRVWIASIRRNGCESESILKWFVQRRVRVRWGLRFAREMRGSPMPWRFWTIRRRDLQ